jgi:cytochrome c5
MSNSEEKPSSRVKMPNAMLLAIVAMVALIAMQDAWAQVGDRSGKEVVETVCSTCHGIGAEGAPRIGDAKAWTERASQGLTTLTQHAINGIRKMPAHGGNSGVTDFEIKRAVTYIVNQSGGSWIEPVDKGTPRVERTGEEIVQAQCAKCHRTGEGGAPKIGDLAAWKLRLEQGLDGAVRSAINGHGGMPARGGMTNLTDTEVKSAVIYLFNPVSIPNPGAADDGRSEVSFSSEVQPIFEKHCIECHDTRGEGVTASGFSVRSYGSVMRGTKYGPVVEPGSSIASTLYLVVSHKTAEEIQMPPHHRNARAKDRGSPLSRYEIAKIEAWIDQGAQDN